MQHRVEILLEVDAFAEAVGADQDTLAGLGKLEHTLFAFRRGQRACDGGDFDTLGQPFAKLSGDVLGRGNEAAEHDGVVAFLKQPLDHGDDVLELGVLLALQVVGLAGHFQQPAAVAFSSPANSPMSLPGAVSIPSAPSSSSRSSTVRRPISSASSGVSVSATAARLRSVAAAAAGLEARQRSKAKADHHRTRWR